MREVRQRRHPSGVLLAVRRRLLGRVRALPHPLEPDQREVPHRRHRPTLDDFVRVTRPGGEIILVNHIGAESGALRLAEQGFAPLARRLGWRPEFRWGRLAQWAQQHGGVRVVERRPVPPLGLFSLIRFERVGQGTGAARQAATDGQQYA